MYCDTDNTKLPIQIPIEVFDIPVHEIRRGYRSDVYFWRAKRTLEKHKMREISTIQVFQKKKAILCGIEEVLALLALGTGHYRNPQKAFDLFDSLMRSKKRVRSLYLADQDKLNKAMQEKTTISQQLDSEWVNALPDMRVYSLQDGDKIDPWEPVLVIEGPLSEIVHLETLYLGVLARRTRIATNVSRVAKAANNKPVFFYPARFDHWAVQGGDGYAASVGGVNTVSTDAQGEWWGMKGGGTIPHCLIAACHGNTLLATERFSETFPDTPLVALVDFENDCVRTSLEVARSLGEKLWAVRLDTSEKIADVSVMDKYNEQLNTGVTPQLVRNVRYALDQEGFNKVHIVVSGGFDAEKISIFENEQVPADVYGVGSAFMKGSFDFTADVVKVNNQPMAKKGRSYRINERLIERSLI
ncbi:MAG: quinolinate phosphoribosyl transferase [Acidiferrobacteraceae bacterium]|nr:quinolinate phosphoribosyl transferase [Acidiferrobacteraceae bacterium]|tara:strand:+ start:19495 stop:20736 length:1242 start_codon:yes stop_codon:yes gene_type:complete